MKRIGYLLGGDSFLSRVQTEKRTPSTTKLDCSHRQRRNGMNADNLLSLTDLTSLLRQLYAHGIGASIIIAKFFEILRLSQVG